MRYTNIRELVFGAQDGMVSTLGALTGIAIGSGNHFFVILSGLVVVAVEATSMGIGSYLSTKSVAEIAKRRFKAERSEIGRYIQQTENPQRAGVTMFFSYIAGGFIPILAYLFLPIENAIFISIGMTLFALFLLGVGVARFTGQKLLRSGLRMLLVAGVAVVVGLGVGNFVSLLFAGNYPIMK